jgi:hypothetical protein
MEQCNRGVFPSPSRSRNGSNKRAALVRSGCVQEKKSMAPSPKAASGFD